MRSVVIVVAVVCTGCLRGTAFQCTDDTDCIHAGAQGTCEIVSYCSFDDASCPGGRRFGDLSGPFANQCIDPPDPPDAAPPDDAPGDQDSDGVVDPDDNCPAIANAAQVNEDADRFGDACDTCPPVADDTAADGDSDGVGDGCDPNPGAGGDQILVFEGFAAGIPAGWENIGGWTATAGDAVIMAMPNPASYLAIPPALAPTTGHETVRAALIVDAFNGTFSVMGVVAEHAPAADSSVACRIYQAPAPVTPSPGLAVNETTNPAGALVVGYEMMLGATYDVMLHRDQTTYTCTATRGGTVDALTATFALANTPSSLGIRVSGGTLRARWVMVISSP